MTEQTREILNSLSSLYPLQDYEEQAIDDALQSEQRRWIPCKERLPEVLEDVLLTSTILDQVTIGWRYDDGTWAIHEGENYVCSDEVTAWKPLPEPYKEGTQ